MLDFRYFLNELKRRVTTPIHLFVMVAGSVLLTIAGPFGTFEQLPVAERALFWGLVVVLALVLSQGIRICVSHALPDRSALVVNLCVAASMTLTFSPVVYGMVLMANRWRETGGAHPLAIVGYVAAVSLAVSMTRWILHVQNDEAPRLMARLPDHLWGDLVRLSSSDHYVEVVTAKGRETLLMRFADALAELDGVEGARVHRSHWVAKQAVAANERENGRIFLRLVDGSRIPVSRSYMEDARAAGMIQDAA